MLKILSKGSNRQFCDGLKRRSFLQIGGPAMGGLSLPEILALENTVPKTVKSGGLGHKAVIMIYMPGTLVLMGLNSPRISRGASILRSYMS